MALIADTSGLIASIDRNEPAHARVRRILEAEPEAVVVPELVIAEVDYLLMTRVGRQAQEAFLDDLVSGAYVREEMRDDDLRRALRILRRFGEHDLGIVDTSILATAERLGIERILTLDLRHFRMLKLKERTPLTLLPFDEES
ncbi:MAG: type II toxin-antitoxin system VapC family toxin [Myxococcota bacterium]